MGWSQNGKTTRWKRMQRADSNSGIGIAMALMFGSTLFLSGCSIFHTEIGKPLKKPAVPLVEEKTSVRTIVDELGPPHLVSALSNGFVFLYEYHRIRELQWGVSLKAVKLPYFKLVKADSRLSESVRILTFDDRGILQAEGTAVWDEKLSAGVALQLIVSAISLTDTTPFRQGSETGSWGRRLLERLPRVLNSKQNLADGSHGVEIISSPDYVGQSTLEMVRPRPLKEESSRSLRSN